MFIKDLFRLIKSSFNRFIFLLCIVLIGTGFLMGLSTTSPIMMKSVEDYYNSSNYMDTKIYSNFGFCDEDIEALKKEEYIKDIVASKEVDAYIKVNSDDSFVARFEEFNSDINKVNLVYGHYPIQEDECLISNSHLFELGEGIDDVIDKYITVYLPSDDDIEDSLKYSRYKIVGSFNSPEAMSKILGTSNLDNKELDTIILIKSSNFKSDYYTDIKVTYNDSFKYNAFKDDYKEYADNCLDSLKDLAEEQKYICKNKIVDEALEEIHDGEKELAEEKEKGEKDLAKAKRELNDALKELKDGEQKIIDGEDEIAKNEQKIKDNESYLSSQSATVNSNISAIETASGGTSFDTLYTTVKGAYNDYLSLKESKTTHVIDQRFFASDPSLETTYNALIAGLPDTQDQLDIFYAGYDSFVDAALAAYDGTFAPSLETNYNNFATLYNARAAINDGYRQLSDGKKQIEDAKQTIVDNKKKIEDGWKDYYKGLKEYKDGVKEFDEKIADAQKEIDDAYKELEDLKDPKWIFLDRSLDYSYALYKGSCEQMDRIAKIMPLLFFLVGILVCITTMTRLVQEQRTQIGTYRALGYSRNTVIIKYVCYALLASLLGSVLGIIVGMFIFPTVIYSTWRLMYILPSMKVIIPPLQLSISLLSFTLIMVAVTYFVVRDTLKEKPNELLRPKAPKSSKPIILEKIKFIWDRISFTGKVTCRNIFRYKARFFMTIIGVAGCTGLLVLGFGIKDSISDVVNIQYNEFYQYDYIVNLKEDIDNNEVKEVLKEVNSNKDTQYSSPYLEYTGKIYIDDAEKTINVEVFDSTDFDKSFDLLNYKSNSKIELGNEGVIITEKFAKDNKLKEGDVISFESNDGTLKEVMIKEICKTYFQHYLYISDDLYNLLFSEDTTPNKIATAFNGSLDELEDSIINDDVISVTDFSSFIASFENMIQSLDLIILVIILTAGSLAFVVLFNLIEVNIAERIREIATLKVLGFRRREIYSYIFKEIILLTILGGSIGLILGNYEVKIVMGIINVDSIMFSCDVKALSYVYAFLITIVFTAIVLIFTRRTLNNIKMAESLKSIE